MRTTRATALLFKFYICLIFCFVFAPIIASFVFSFNSDRFPTIPLGSFTLHWYLTIYNDTDIFLLRIDKADKKYVRRSEVINGTGRLKDIGAMSVLAYFGDAYHDFPDEDENYIFGSNMFMFPNPMYGKW